MPRFICCLLLAFLPLRLSGASFTVATWNLEFYIDAPALNVPPKTPEARQLIRAAIKKINPDVLALQEVGALSALEELRASLRKEGLDFPHLEHVRAWDSNLRLAFLSKVPITARRPHTNETFLFEGRRFRVARGFGEIEVSLGKNQRLTLLNAHLKSKRQVAEADQQGLREEEAALLRERIDDFFRREPRGRLIVLGDLNDDISSRTLRTVIGRGRTKLFDPRPAEQNGDTLPNPNTRFEPRRILWTHYYAKEDLYSRVDYILLSPNLAGAVRHAYVLTMPDWGAASDHRPVAVTLSLSE